MRFMNIPIFLGVFLGIVGLEIMLVCNYKLGILLFLLALVCEYIENKRIWPMHDGFEPVCDEHGFFAEMYCYQKSSWLALFFVVGQCVFLFWLCFQNLWVFLFFPLALLFLALVWQKEMSFRYKVFSQCFIQSL